MMYTQCRGCGELFTIEVDELVTSAAQVRCSACGTVFNALETLADYKPTEDSDLILHEQDNPPPLLNHELKEPIIPEEGTVSKIKVESHENIEPSSGFEPDFVVEPELENIPFAVEENTKKSPMLWSFLVFSLIAVATLQLIQGIKRGSIKISNEELKAKICSTIKCYYQQDQSKLDNIALVSRSIRQHPGRDNALIVSIGMINGDDETQAYPALQVKMSDINGNVVAMRRFLPEEYIGLELTKTGMLSNTLVPVNLELQSPGQNAVTFEVNFTPTFESDA